jgi:pyruvate dehydrogenase E1 component alpha subunit
MMAELLGRSSGTCGGKGGSMHIADFEVGMLGANGVVAANIPIGAGAAHAIKLRGEDRVVVCLFGDGAINRGPFLEGLNWARVYDLPVLFVCEDNGFAATTRTEALTGGEGPAARADSIGLPAYKADGNDVLAVDDIAADLIARIRAREGPQFLVAETYRLTGHTGADPAAYRPESEVESARSRDPLVRSAGWLHDAGVDKETIAGIDRAARDEIDRAVAAAEAAAWPRAEAAYSDVQDVGAERSEHAHG